jgi:uncharacterized membrane protein YfcA
MLDTDQLDALTWIAMALILAFAGLVHGTLGIGFPMVATPLLAIMTDVRTAVMITLVPTVAVNIISIAYGGRWRESIGAHWPLAAIIPIGCIAGSWLLIRIDPSPFRLLLAAIILLYLFQEKLPVGRLAWIRQHRWLGYILFGLAAGFSAGTVNVMVPLLIIFTLELGLSTLAMIQLFNLCFLSGKLTQIIFFSGVGAVTPAAISTTLPLALVAATLLLVGVALRKRIQADTYRIWLRRLLGVMVIGLISQFLFSL